MRFWEEGTRTAAPTCILFEMNKEPCKAWSMMNGDKKISVLAASLVSRLEVFCLRLAASGAGGAVRTKVLCAGWRPQVATEPFLRRGFNFEGAPDETLGFKMLKSDEARAREAAAAAAKEAAAKEAAAKAAAAQETGAAAEATDSAADESGGMARSMALGLNGKRKRAEPPMGDVDSPMGAATPVPLRTPGTSSSGAGSSLDPMSGTGAHEVGHVATADQSDDDEPSESEPEPEPEVEAEEWGDISAIGRFTSTPAATQLDATQLDATQLDATQLDATQLDGSQPGQPGASGAAIGGEDMDDVDATLAELLG